MRLRPMPVVMVSHLPRLARILRGAGTGAIDFIGKPRSDGGRSMETYAEELVEKFVPPANVCARAVPPATITLL